MTDDLFTPAGVALPDATPAIPATASPALPQPLRTRWQPLRLGLVELFHYDSEEFWFHDGRLLLRGNNGTGKSKVLSLTLPFLFDAQLRPSRIEPDGDSGKKMAWNLLMNSYQRRIGYTWIEFGRRAEDGSLHYLTLGAGLSAVAGRAQVESWFFILEDAAGGGPRIGQDLWLINEQRSVLTRERLREAIGHRGQLFETAGTYRRAVDERLLRLGVRRYDALMDTLIQLRQPQLSRKPDETALSDALTEALPPLPTELLADVAEALNQLEEDHRQLEEARALEQAVRRFDDRYRLYAGMLSRRQARTLRQAQTEFDNASQAHNAAQTRLQAAQSAEVQAVIAQDEAERALAAERVRLQTLQADPAMQDANRLQEVRRAVERCSQAQQQAAAALLREQAALRREETASRDAALQADRAGQLVTARRQDCAAAAAAEAAGITTLDASPLYRLPLPEAAALSAGETDAAATTLRDGIRARREQLALLQHRHADLRQATQAQLQQHATQREAQADLEDATRRRATADDVAESAAEALVQAWSAHCNSLAELRLPAADTLLQALAAWAARPEGDENPLRQALLAAQQQASARHAALGAELDGRRQALAQEQAALVQEHEALSHGRDAPPPLPHTRDPEARRGRSGAPLWQLVEFRDHVAADDRAGIEAALEAAGLLDAWVTPDGALLSSQADPLRLDSQWVRRAPVAGALAQWLTPATDAASDVPADAVAQLLAGVACGADDDGAHEAWVAPDGRFRLGALAGAWRKPQAQHIGHAARAAARRQRLAAIAQRLQEIDAAAAELAQQATQLEQARRRAEAEWRNAPDEAPLRHALAEAAACERQVGAARARLERSEARCRQAEEQLHAAREALQRDAADMGLPAEATALPAVAAAIEHFDAVQQQLVQAVHEWRRAYPELRTQQAREDEARSRCTEAEEQLGAARLEHEEAQARFETLRAAVGARVESLQQQLAQAQQEVDRQQSLQRATADARRQAGEVRARTEAEAESAAVLLTERTRLRAAAVAELQRFAASSLLASALPGLELPGHQPPWTIDPALTLSRRVEQLLAHLTDDGAAWSRVQRQVAEDLQELQRALSALGQRAAAEPCDWGQVVHIIFQNRAVRPDELAVQLAAEVTQRSELLSAREREVLENYLQAEIASEVQRLLRAADKQVNAINRELHKRPTSTGVRYRLQWQPLPEDEGAPVGLEAARARLLNTSADLWSPEDRRVVGTMLQQRIHAQRQRSDGDAVALIDQLAAALDYRRWHRFRVERLQDGQWRKLSGPASSGERALGLTVPLFAAVASFYSEGSHPHAPRLMLLDEAFAGIDDAARAHCMGLIREFDLDFVITSEREWACYAELPGVAICQLQRREGIDAVHVSRWTWDGSARRREEDPDRRFAPA